MSVRQLWEGCDAAVWARKLDGRTKLLILFLVAVLAIVVDNPRTLFLLFTATLLLHLSARTSIYKWQVLAILLLLGLWGSMFSQALFFAQTPRTPLFVLIAPEAGFIGQLTGGLFIYREGILYGAVQGLRSASMPATCWMKAVFLATASTQVTCISGQQMAITTPGKPPPLPTSSKGNAPPWVCLRNGAMIAKLSSTWCVSISAGLRTAVRL